MNFNQDGVTSDQILRSLRALIVDGSFKADALIIDGFDFTRTSVNRIAEIKKFASELGLEIWYTCTVVGDDPVFDKRNVPIVLKDFIDLIEVVVILEPKQDFIQFSVSKDYDVFNPHALELKLDTKTLLIAEK
jgi:hypothetical protein